MCVHHRRAFLLFAGSGIASLLFASRPATALSDEEKFFVAEALRMQHEAAATGDQHYGAVIVRAGEIIGYGPSRVLADRNPAAHAERVALWDAQRRLGTADLSGAVIYSTSRPCSACQDALSRANIDRMRVGADASDAGKPRRG